MANPRSSSNRMSRISARPRVLARGYAALPVNRSAASGVDETFFLSSRDHRLLPTSSLKREPVARPARFCGLQQRHVQCGPLDMRGRMRLPRPALQPTARRTRARDAADWYRSRPGRFRAPQAKQERMPARHPAAGHHPGAGSRFNTITTVRPDRANCRRRDQTDRTGPRAPRHRIRRIRAVDRHEAGIGSRIEDDQETALAIFARLHRAGRPCPCARR